MSTTPEQDPQQPATNPRPPRPPKSARNMFCTSILALEAFVMLFATLVAHGLRVAPLPWVWSVGAVAFVACIAGAALMRKHPGPIEVLGWVIQAGLALSALLVPLALALAVIFALLWLIALRTGSDIDHDRVERYRAELAYYDDAVAAQDA